MKTKLWDVQEKVGNEWVSIYSSPFESWDEAKGVLDESLDSQRKMNQDNPIRLIEVNK